MKKIFFFFLFLQLISKTKANDISVLLFSDEKISTLSISVKKGNYDVLVDNQPYQNVSANDSLNCIIQHTPYGIKLSAGSAVRENIKSISFLDKDSTGIFLISSLNSRKLTSSYDGNFEISSNENTLFLSNKVNIESYVASVLSGEIGYNAQPEFLKSKAIICRTYALASRNRHLPDSTVLCSSVHCQVYKGNADVTNQITRAVRATRGKIIVDKIQKPIVASFHSNCGGQTVNSEDGFSSYLPYLRSVVDSFCLNQPHAHWEEKISVAEWKKYLAKNKVDTFGLKDFNFDNLERKKNYSINSAEIPVKNIRTDRQFKSSWFSISQHGDVLNFRGRGYGHGVGLCQEGAMHMAEMDYSHRDIISFYFTGVMIISP